ncbi:MAG: phosphohistidine phosphatase SixA [Methanoregula sp.]|jgi:phosphohistidine phosphatase|nr:phosphohistidine phosphatase SixA [Methanoregula sp.]
MDVFILRHGKAEDARHGHGDADRRLTKKGYEEIVAVANWMAAQGLEFDLIAASPLARARGTAVIVADVLNREDKLVTWDMLVPGGNPDTVCREIDRHANAGAILIVGHEPLLSSLISRIIAGDAGAGIIMTKGALAKIRNFSFAQRPSGSLHWLITAKQMAGVRN